MIDTIKIAWNIQDQPSPDELGNCGWQRRFDERSGEVKGWCFGEPQRADRPRLVLFEAPNGLTYLTARVSLPAFARGSNARLLTATQAIFSLTDMATYVSTAFGRILKISDGNVWEVDFARDVSFQPEVICRVINRLAELRINGFHRARHSDTTIYLHSGKKYSKGTQNRTICIYSKQHDCIARRFSNDDIMMTEGVIRFEYRFRRSAAIKQFAKTNNIKDTKVTSIVNVGVETLVLDPLISQATESLSPESGLAVISALRQKYGLRRTHTLLAFLVYRHFYGDEFYRLSDLAFSRSAYYSCQRDTRAAGIYEIFPS